jgi:hypothetical protein
MSTQDRSRLGIEKMKRNKTTFFNEWQSKQGKKLRKKLRKRFKKSMSNTRS